MLKFRKILILSSLFVCVVAFQNASPPIKAWKISFREDVAGCQSLSDCVSEKALGENTNGYLEIQAKLPEGVQPEFAKSTDAFGEEDFSERFHTFALDLKPGQWIWYINGIEHQRFQGGLNANPVELLTQLTLGRSTTLESLQDFKLKHFRKLERGNVDGDTPNLISNPGFEQETSGWDLSGMALLSMQSQTGHSAARIEGVAQFQQTLNELEPFTVYELSASLNVLEGDDNGAVIGVKNYGAQSLAHPCQAQGLYKRCTLKFVTGDTRRATVYFTQSKGISLADDFVLKVAP